MTSRFMNKIKLFLMISLQPILYWLLGTAAAASLLFWQLGSLTSEFAEPELNSLRQLLAPTANLNEILIQPLYLPHTLISYLFVKLPLPDIMSPRLVSAAIGLVVVGSFYMVLRYWYSTRIALYGLVVFATSSWFLHTARLGTPDVLFLLTMPIIAGVLWCTYNHKYCGLATLFTIIATSMSLYVPGFVWLVILGAVWQRKLLRKSLAKLSVLQLLICGLVAVICIVPLIFSLAGDTEPIKQLLGLPMTWPTWQVMLKNFALAPIRLFIHGPSDPLLWVGRIPLLDLLTTTMAVVGVFAALKKWRLAHVQFVFAGLLLGSLFIALGGPVHITIIMPFVFILVASGLEYMLDLWFTVFPRNPLARRLGVGLLTVAIAMSVTFQLGHYFIAWPRAPQTKAIFTHNL